MSYILDALKKAEQERGVTWAPPEAASNDSPAIRRNHLAVFAGATVLIAAAGTWFLLSRATPSQNPPVASLEQNPAANPPESQALPARENPPASPAETAPPETARLRNLPSPASAKLISGSAPVADVPSVPEDAMRAPPARKVPEPAAPLVAARSASEQQLPETLSPRPAESAIPSAAESPVPSVAPAPAAAASAPGRPLRLQEAVTKMKLTLLVYAENEPERVVYINGRKYAKGDLVDGLYLVESITPDGVLLSYEGQRTTLRP
jgi:general secretion pathway protein B